jgi:hypothetical protein
MFSKMVCGQLRVGRPQIHNHWSAFRRSSFLDDKQLIHAMPSSRQVKLYFRVARHPVAISRAGTDRLRRSPLESVELSAQ